jgi:elongation factor Ts
MNGNNERLNMPNFTSADIKRLRELTGAGMLDCKNALGEAGGDTDRAVELLRIKGAKDVSKRAERTAANGLVAARLDGTSSGLMVELLCETDFVSKNEGFQRLAGEIVDAAARARPADRLALQGAEVAPGVTVQQRIEEVSASIKEKLELGRYEHLEGGFIASYLHKTDPSLPPTVGVLVQLDSENADLAKELALQIAAVPATRWITRDEVPADVVEKERRIAEEMTREEGKPERAIPKIVEGRLGAFFKDVVLTEQPYVKDQKKAVGTLVSDAGVTVRAFARFKVGQA